MSASARPVAHLLPPCPRRCLPSLLLLLPPLAGVGAAPLFVPACHVDTALTRSLVVHRRDFDDLIRHKQGAPKVAAEMERQWQLFGSQRQVMSMVDRDKRLEEIASLADFTELVGGNLLLLPGGRCGRPASLKKPAASCQPGASRRGVPSQPALWPA